MENGVANAVNKLPDTFAAAIELYGVVDREFVS